MSTQARVDIVIVNYQCADEIALCLQALGEWKHGIIWLVDNSAADATSTQDSLDLAVLAYGRSDVRLVRASENGGFGAGCNLAFEQSQADLLMLLNPDARMLPAAIELLIETLWNRPELGAIAPTMYWNSAQTFIIPHSVHQTPWASLTNALATRFGWLANRLALSGLRDVQRKALLAQAFPVDFLTGAVVLIRRAAAQQAAQVAQLPQDCLFDPDYFMFFEDSDLSLRLRRAGWALAVHPGASAVHGYRHKAFKAGLMAKARLHYFRKRFPAFFRWSGQLTWLDALSRPVDPLQRYASVAETVSCWQELAEKTQHAGLLALSPTMVGWPAFVRSPNSAPLPLSEAEWALLEPGHYLALIQPAGGGEPRWVHFARTAGSSAA